MLLNYQLASELSLIHFIALPQVKLQLSISYNSTSTPTPFILLHQSDALLWLTVTTPIPSYFPL